MPTLGQYTLAELKAAIDAAITSKTLPGSILNTDDGALRKNIVEDLFLKIQNISPGSGSSALFPNGIKIITESRDLQADDAGCLLVLSGGTLISPTILTLPNPSPLSIGNNFAITVSDYPDGANNGVMYNGDIVLPALGEVVVFTTIDLLGTISSLILSTSNVDNKTALRYLIDNVGSGGQIAFTKTKAEIDTLIAGGDLVSGALYEITGVHPTLYDDGTTSGTTVYLRAISGSELEVQGMGKFYNPKYNQAVNGFGIWENKMYGTFSSISGTFDYQNKEAVTANNAATGILLADGMIQFVSGDWSTATSITGDVSSATATVAGFVTPTYSIGDKVIWGGYSWTNVNGNVGASTDVLNLNAEWSKNVYDTTNYNIAYDVIEYDYTNDMIIRRHEIESNVDIRCNKVQLVLFGFYGLNYNPISVQQFGNVFNLSTFKGQLNINVNGGYNESVNFCGAYQSNFTFGHNAYQGNLTFGHNAYQSSLTFGQNASQYNITFGQNARQLNLTFGQSSSQLNLTFGQNAYQSGLTFGQKARQSNLTFGQNTYQTNIEFDINTRLNYNSQTLSTSINNARFRTNGGVVTPNISTATYIYDNTLLKDIYTRPDGTLKIRYYDNSDVLQIVDIDD